MYNRPRIIPTLLLDNGNLVKTKRFSKPRYLGDPINAIKIFNEKGVDELCVLDITASKNSRGPDMDMLESMASEAFMPLSYGGGITNIEQIRQIFRMGFEKVVINTAFETTPEIVREAADYCGSQSVVVAIDYKNSILGQRCMIANGEIKTHIQPLERALKAQQYGAGEILLYSIDQDGMREGYDIKTIKKVTEQLTIPVIACGGADTIDDIYNAIYRGGADAVAAGSMFVYYGKKEAVLINFPDEKILIERKIYEEE